MICPVQGGKVTADFNEPRPLKAVKKTHVHGAWDLAAPVGTPVLAPEDGDAYFFMALRDKGYGGNMPQPKNLPFNFQGAGYWYDIYGAIIVLVSRDYTHLMAHSYFNQLFNRPEEEHTWRYQESEGDDRWPQMLFYTRPRAVKAGSLIGKLGNAGFSTGPHVHWEIHKGSSLLDYSKRENPAAHVKEGFVK